MDMKPPPPPPPLPLPPPRGPVPPRRAPPLPKRLVFDGRAAEPLLLLVWSRIVELGFRNGCRQSGGRSKELTVNSVSMNSHPTSARSDTASAIRFVRGGAVSCPVDDTYVVFSGGAIVVGKHHEE